jgi:hypothetical protein
VHRLTRSDVEQFIEYVSSRFQLNPGPGPQESGRRIARPIHEQQPFLP